jgi:two-component system OmpR family sensor kinase
VARRDDVAELQVVDHGPGIPEAERDRIFERFYRIDSANSRMARGVGIGLALTRELVGLLQGSIAVVDTPGGGATFRVTLPLAPHDDAGAGNGASPGDAARPGASLATASPESS